MGSSVIVDISAEKMDEGGLGTGTKKSTGSVFVREGGKFVEFGSIFVRSRLEESGSKGRAAKRLTKEAKAGDNFVLLANEVKGVAEVELVRGGSWGSGEEPVVEERILVLVRLSTIPRGRPSS